MIHLSRSNGPSSDLPCPLIPFIHIWMTWKNHYSSHLQKTKFDEKNSWRTWCWSTESSDGNNFDRALSSNCERPTNESNDVFHLKKIVRMESPWNNLLDIRDGCNLQPHTIRVWVRRWTWYWYSTEWDNPSWRTHGGDLHYFDPLLFPKWEILKTDQLLWRRTANCEGWWHRREETATQCDPFSVN